MVLLCPFLLLLSSLLLPLYYFGCPPPPAWAVPPALRRQNVGQRPDGLRLCCRTNRYFGRG
jgi:hypothetical protein